MERSVRPFLKLFQAADSPLSKRAHPIPQPLEFMIPGSTRSKLRQYSMGSRMDRKQNGR